MGQSTTTNDCNIIPGNPNTNININANITDKQNDYVISYNDSTDTIDFHNKPVVNFSGGGGGGGGDVFTSTNNTYDVGVVNTFQGNTVMTTVGATGKVTCVALDAGAGKIETTADVECVGLNAGNAKIETTANVECVDVVASGDVECVDVVASGDITCTNFVTGDVECVDVVASGDVSCVGFSASTVATTGDINIVGGDLICDRDMTAETLVTQGNITATVGSSIIHGNTVLSDTNISCGAGGNFLSVLHKYQAEIY